MKSAESSKTYAGKFRRIVPGTAFALLPQAEQAFLRGRAFALRFSHQELRKVTEMALERLRWKETPLSMDWPTPADTTDIGALKKRTFAQLESAQHLIRSRENSYAGFSAEDKPKTRKPVLQTRTRRSLGLGHCPVASSRTRCCNLLTLDAVEKCGFDCSYCSIQSFYHGDEVGFDAEFADKLQALELDAEKIYHIGTGQSSDSLMWGNHGGVLAALCEFAHRHPNVILELKTKSKNIGWLLEHDIPPNLLCTWSLNTPTIIDHEEHLSASLQQRIASARAIADRGNLVGFHFHPIVHYDNWSADYPAICEQLTAQFRADEVALISLGTLTFTRAVMKTIRNRPLASKILQMPLQDSAGKLSYPAALKREMFRRVYRSLGAWHNSVFFYLCMEPQLLWKPVFGYDYADNNAFETAMKTAYMRKIEAVRQNR